MDALPALLEIPVELRVVLASALVVKFVLPQLTGTLDDGLVRRAARVLRVP